MIHMLCLGDSITDCGRFFEDFPLGNGYVRILADTLEKQGIEISITNNGVDGFTVARLLSNAQAQHLPLAPDIITILIGINDVGLMMNTGRTPGQQESMMLEFFQNYDHLLEILKGTGSKIILMEPFIFPWPQEYCSWIPLVKTMSQGISLLAQKYQLPYLLLHDFLNEEGRRYGLDFITTDGIHLTRQGHEILADKLNRLFSEKGIL